MTYSISPSPGDGGALAVLSNLLLVWSMKSTEITATVIRTISQSTNQPGMEIILLILLLLLLVVLFLLLLLLLLFWNDAHCQLDYNISQSTNQPEILECTSSHKKNEFVYFFGISLKNTLFWLQTFMKKLCFIDRRKVSWVDSGSNCSSNNNANKQISNVFVRFQIFEHGKISSNQKCARSRSPLLCPQFAVTRLLRKLDKVACTYYRNAIFTADEGAGQISWECLAWQEVIDNY